MTEYSAEQLLTDTRRLLCDERRSTCLYWEGAYTDDPRPWPSFVGKMCTLYELETQRQ